MVIGHNNKYICITCSFMLAYSTTTMKPYFSSHRDYIKYSIYSPLAWT